MIYIRGAGETVLVADFVTKARWLLQNLAWYLFITKKSFTVS